MPGWLDAIGSVALAAFIGWGWLWACLAVVILILRSLGF